MRFPGASLLVLLLALHARAASAQAILTGRMAEASRSGAEARMCFGGILCFASLPHPASEARPFRTWETDPVGWYRISGSAGNYTIVFSDPARYVRPVVLTNIWLEPAEATQRDVVPRFDRAVFHEGAWDGTRASRYFQPFTAAGKSVTHVGFKLASDGVDGGGPGSQDLVVAIRRCGPGTPEAWEQVGPAQAVPGVDCGGPKNHAYSAGWNSGEVPTVRGETYAVELRTAMPAGAFQAFWRPRADGTDGCFRISVNGEKRFEKFDLWFAVGSDSDGIVIPYQKRVHRQFVEFAGFRSRWAQTWAARGRSLASVILYAAVGGTQPPLDRQRIAVRVREGGAGGKVVGMEKIGVGNGNYTGDASWGTFGAAFAPGEAPLVPGRTYAVEFESVESHETLHGFVNAKGQVSDDRPGFNPYRKCAPDGYPQGTAYAGGTEAVDFDLDMQILEYEFGAGDWADAVEPKNLLENGDMESGQVDAERAEAGRPGTWIGFSLTEGTVLQYVLQPPERKNRFLRVAGSHAGKETVDGGWVQRVESLSRSETYRLSGLVRCSWPVDSDRGCQVGYDPTGQAEDPKASTIVWTSLPAVHGMFVPYRSRPVRPARDSVSVWLRAHSGSPERWPFKADFDDFALQRVRTEPPAESP